MHAYTHENILVVQKVTIATGSAKLAGVSAADQTDLAWLQFRSMAGLAVYLETRTVELFLLLLINRSIGCYNAVARL